VAHVYLPCYLRRSRRARGFRCAFCTSPITPPRGLAATHIRHPPGHDLIRAIGEVWSVGTRLAPERRGGTCWGGPVRKADGAAQPERGRSDSSRRLPTMRSRTHGLPLAVRLRLIDSATSQLLVAAPAKGVSAGRVPGRTRPGPHQHVPPRRSGASRGSPALAAAYTRRPPGLPTYPRSPIFRTALGTRPLLTHPQIAETR
jgi:hypothetical protein